MTDIINDVTDIGLSNEDHEWFVDLWECQRGLWDPADPQFKNRTARVTAMNKIAEAFGKGWSIEDVKRKIDSLRAYYRKQKKRSRELAANGSVAYGKKVWPLYDRIHSFLGGVQYSRPSLANSQMDDDDLYPQEVVDMASAFSVEEEEGHASSSSEGSRSNIVTPPCKRRVTEKNSVPQPKFKDTPNLCKMASAALNPNTKENRTRNPNDTNMNFAVTVADRLDQIRNRRRLEVVKNKMDNLLHEALMEDLSDD
ncbi:hypothetical protein ACOMHN_022848 [Nucella lapillus]